MDLIKLDFEKLELRETLRTAEGKTIMSRRAAQSDALRRVTGFLVMLTSMFVPLMVGILTAFAIAASHPFLAFLVGMGGAIAAFVAGLASFARYLDPPDRKLLPYLLEPKAKAFFLANAERRERLLEEAEAFDLALGVFKGLPERAGDEVYEGVAENFAERRARHEADIAAYVRDFEAATVEDRARVAAVEAQRKMPRDPRTRELEKFADKVRQLAWVERSLDGLEGSVEKGMTVDLSPYVAAQRLRDEIAAERAALVGRGLKPKRLPKPRVVRKFLQA